MHSHHTETTTKRYEKAVLILVVMEDALALCRKNVLLQVKRVLILVVMEDALAPLGKKLN